MRMNIMLYMKETVCIYFLSNLGGIRYEGTLCLA